MIAFFKLMKEKGFKKITVRNLTECAGINRTTFYLHYADKYELLNHVEDQLLKEIKIITGGISLDGLSKAVFREKIFEMVVGILNYIKENAFRFSVLIGPNGNPNFMVKYGDVIRGILENNYLLSKLPLPGKYVLAIIVGAHTNLIREWIAGGMKESPKEMAGVIARIVGGVVKELFFER